MVEGIPWPGAARVAPYKDLARLAYTRRLVRKASRQREQRVDGTSADELLELHEREWQLMVRGAIDAVHSCVPSVIDRVPQRGTRDCIQTVRNAQHLRLVRRQVACRVEIQRGKHGLGWDARRVNVVHQQEVDYWRHSCSERGKLGRDRIDLASLDASRNGIDVRHSQFSGPSNQIGCILLVSKRS